MGIILLLFHFYHLSSLVFCALCFTHTVTPTNLRDDTLLHNLSFQTTPAYGKLSQRTPPSLFFFLNHYSMLIYFHIYIKLIPRFWCWIICLSYINVNILGSDSTPPPVSKMSPVSNKFEGIPQQQRYQKKWRPRWNLKLDCLQIYCIARYNKMHSSWWGPSFFLDSVFFI